MLTKHLRQFFMLSFAACYLSNYFLRLPWLTVVTSLLLIVVIAQAITGLPRTNFRVCTGLFLIGAVILFLSEASFLDWLAAVHKNAGLIALFITLPLFGMPLQYENYQLELKHIAEKYLTSVWAFCLLIMLVTHILGIVISLGVVVLVYTLFRETAGMYKAEGLFLLALMQSYMTTGFWSPAWASMAVVTHELQIPWIFLIPLGILLSILALALSLLLIFIKIKRSPGKYLTLTPNPSVMVHKPYMYTMLALVGGLILAVVALSYYTKWEILVIIPLVALFFPLAAAFFQRKMPQYQSEMRKYYSESLFKVKNEVVLFTAAGFLGKSLELSGIEKTIPGLLPVWLSSSVFSTILFLMLIMIAVSLIGIHPVITGSALIGALDPAALGLSSFIFAETMLCGWALTIMLSPFSAINLIMGGMTGRPSWDISLKLNWFYGILMMVILASVLTMLN